MALRKTPRLLIDQPGSEITQTATICLHKEAIIAPYR